VALRTELKAAGYAPVSPVIFVGLGDVPEMVRASGLFMLTPAEDDRCELARIAWRLDDVSKGYRDFITQVSTLADLPGRQPLRDEDALVARTLLIHAFRRLVLRDPGLPRDLLPDHWEGDAARALAARIYHSLVGPSEAFLDRASNAEGPLPRPDARFQERFSK
jgi:phenylacetic acid degradation operon negative regulatory protein